MKKLDLNRLRLLDILPEDRDLLLRYNSGESLTEKELEKVYFLDTPDISDFDFNTLDEEDEMYFIAENNPDGFDILKNLSGRDFQAEKVRQLFFARLFAKQKEELEVQKILGNIYTLDLGEVRQTKSEEEKKPVTIRLSVSDVEKIKKIAENEALPYQTLISAIIHKIAEKKIEILIKN